MLKQICRDCEDCDESVYKSCSRRKIKNRCITATKKKFNKNVLIMGGDTETYDGEPLTLQLYDSKNGFCLKWVNKENITDVFLQTLKELNLGHGIKTGIIWFHNLDFDLKQCLFPYLYNFQRGEFILKPNNNESCAKFSCKIDVKCNKVFFASITFHAEGEPKKVRKRFYLRDTMAYFGKKELGKLAEKLKVGSKLEKPKDLGKIKFNDAPSAENDYFKKYALNDALLSYNIGEYILRFNREFDVSLGCSAPNMAQKIFTKHYLKDIKKPIWIASKSVWSACCLSFHGGKNHFNLKKATKLNGVFELDVNSMYPFAMKNLPKWTSGRFEKVYEFSYEYVGVYCISGFAKKCDYPVIPAHDFKYYNGEHFENVWVACYEVMEALRTNEIELKSIWGFIWIPDADATNPLIDYCDYFFKRKKESVGAEKEFMKLCINSIYGKFSQSNNCNSEISAVGDVIRDEYGGYVKTNFTPIKKIWVAGGLCHMFLATLITSFTRQIIHSYQHKYLSLDTSTDSIKTTMEPDEKDIGDDIGKLSIKAYGNTAYLIRNKVYIFFNENGDIVHSARHGFTGSIEKLKEMFENKQTSYIAGRMTTYKESLHSKEHKKPFIWEEKRRDFAVNYGDGMPKDLERAKKEMENYLNDFVDKVYSDVQTFDNSVLDGSLNKKEQKESFLDDIKDKSKND